MSNVLRDMSNLGRTLRLGEVVAALRSSGKIVGPKTGLIFLVMLLVGIACQGEAGPPGSAGSPGAAGPLPALETIEADLQPDPTTLAHQDLNGNEGVDPGEPFSVRASLYEPGSNTKIGDFVCEGVFIANLKVVGLDKPPELTNLVDGQFSAVRQTFNFSGKGTLSVIGSEPGTGPNSNELAVVGGTGQFAGATGIVSYTPALGATLTPAFSADSVAGVPVTFLSARVKFDIRRISP